MELPRLPAMAAFALHAADLALCAATFLRKDKLFRAGGPPSYVVVLATCVLCPAAFAAILFCSRVCEKLSLRKKPTALAGCT